MAGRVLEICCDSLDSARAAAAGGADRIELCVDLAVDGLTPPDELLGEVLAAVDLPVFVLVRCRPGDFVYAEREVGEMCAEIERACQLGASGVVCGALLGDGRIDERATRRFLEMAGGLPFTFHKAFDACADLEAGMGLLAGLGVGRVLTSAGAARAADATARLAGLAEIGGETRVLCGGGVRADNLAGLVGIPRLLEFHSAARPSATQPVDAAEVRAMRDILSATRNLPGMG